MNTKVSLANKYLSKITAAIENIEEDNLKNILEIVEEKYEDRKNIFIAGNGGSAATASHFVADLNKTVLGKRPIKSKILRFRAICLSDNTPLVTAIGNDISYDNIFSEQLKNYANKGDLLIVVTGSGNSKNIINAINTADDLGVQTLGLLGFDGGLALEIVDDYILIESADFGVIEDCHSIIFHLITDYFKKTLGCD